MDGRTKTPTPSADELRQQFGDHMNMTQIAIAAGLSVKNRNPAAFSLVLKRINGRPPSVKGRRGESVWTPEQVSDALLEWAKKHSSVKPATVERVPRSLVAERSRRCNKCIYGTSIGLGDNGRIVACNYIVVTEKRRPCPAGDECTVFVKANSQNTKGEKS